MVLTFDDLPMTGGSLCDTAAVRRVTERLTAHLRAHAIPSLALATPGRECAGPERLARTLARWQEAGAEIGNHTATHPDLNGTPVAEYLADVDLGQRLIDRAIDTPRRWFRPPYLHMGDEAGTKRALEAHLVREGYRLAPVTIDNQEWVYAAVYADARARGDTVLARRVSHAFVDHLEDSMAFYEALSDRVFGRQIPQVLLLHANLLNAEQIEGVTAMLRARGYRFVGMQEALSDPAYDTPEAYVGPRGLSWLQRWALAAGVPVPEEPREAEWVARAYRRIGPRAAGGSGYDGLRSVLGGW